MSALKIEVKARINNSVWESMKRNLTRNENFEAKVGFFDGTYANGESVPYVAALNEEGTHSIPARPFMRVDTLSSENKKKWTEEYIPFVDGIAQGHFTWRQLHELLGNTVKDAMKLAIVERNAPPNSPLTVQKKGFNDPLIETGLMYDSVKSKVERRG